MPTLEAMNDMDEEASILGWARGITAFGLRNSGAVDSELDTAETENDDDRCLAMIPASKENSLSLQTVTDGTRAGAAAYVHLSGASRMDNSGNTYTLSVNNYFNDDTTLPRASFSSAATQLLTPDQRETKSAPVTPSVSIGSPVSDSSRSTLSGAETRPTSQHKDNVMINHSGNFAMAREDGCYVELVTPSKGNIPFHPDTLPHVKAYMSSSFNFGERETLIPLWKPRPRQFPVGVTDVGMIGDVGYFDAEGGFYSLFNIFLTREENESYGYSPPTNFTEYSNLQVRKEIIEPLEIDPSEFLSPGCVDYAVHGKFRLVEQVGSSKLSFRSEALVTRFSHGSVIAYHNSIQGRLNEKHQPARKEYIQLYLNKNAVHWYAYYNDVQRQRPPLKKGHLMLVHTSWSTDSWASAVFSREDDWEKGTYFADLLPYSSRYPNVYAWKAHNSVSTRACPPKANGTPERSDYCIAIGVNSIFTGDPPGHRKSSMKRGLHSLSQSLSQMSIKSTFSNSVSTIFSNRKRGTK